MARPAKHLGAFTMLTSKIVRVEFHHTLHAMNIIDSNRYKMYGTAGYLELLGNCRVFTPFVRKYKEANPNNINWYALGLFEDCRPDCRHWQFKNVRL